MRSTRTLTLSALLVTSLLFAACGGGDDDDASASGGPDATEAPAADGGGDDVTEALEEAAPDETVEVPSADGALTIAEYAAGGSGVEPAAPEEIATVLSLVGTDADGYITDDAIVVQASEADAGLWCETTKRLGLDTYTFIPVLPDGTGVACG